MTTLLVADDEQMFLDFMVRLLQKEHHLLIARNWNEVLEKYESNVWRLNATILDVNMPGLSVDPYTMVEKLLKSNPTVPMIVISGQDIVLRHEFLKMGVFQYHGKPIDIVDLKLSIKSALQHNMVLRKLESYEKGMRDDIKHYQRLLNINPEELRENIASYDTDERRIPILIRTEPGGRPEMLARIINTEMDGGLFFKKVCSENLKNILPYNLQNGDTLYLEGIEHLAKEEYAVLNDFLSGEDKKTGEPPVPDFRLVASASNQVDSLSENQPELARLIESLAKLEYRMEPLRLRQHELSQIITAVFEKHKRARVAVPESVSSQLLELLTAYNWPLNFDELELVMQCLLLTCEEPVLLPKHLHQLDFSDMARSKYPTLDDMVDEHIKKALRLTRGNKSRAARMLGITPKTLYSRIRN